MARSSIQGADPAPARPPGHDTASLGPGDSSDSGSDMMGIDAADIDDPGTPADVTAREDQPHSLLSPDSLDSSSDAAGTGERRSAGADGGKADGWDVGVDKVVTADGREVTDDEDPDLGFVDEAEVDDGSIEDELGERAADEDKPPKRPVSKGHKT